MIHKNWAELIKPNQLVVKPGPDAARSATVVAEPLERGFGLTLGNALRRVLMSSLQGAAITSVQIDNVLHEFSSVAGVREDVTDIVLNLKGVDIRMDIEGPKRLTISAKGPGVVTAGDISEIGGVEILNKEQVICHLDDGADVFMWNKNELGPHMGYLPQGVELFEGSFADNIARFGEVDPDEVERAAKAMDVHALIAAMPKGYNASVGRDGESLSGGQRQRVAIARAIYGNPKLVVLDEPNSSLDEAGDAALARMIAERKTLGTSFVVITHRTSILEVVDKILVLRDGQQQMFGPRDEVLQALAQASQQAQQQAQALQNSQAAGAGQLGPVAGPVAGPAGEMS